MKKKISMLLIAILLMLGLSSTLTAKVSAASWGAKKVYTTPKRTRGNWYYKKNGKIKKLRITTHTLNGVKLYKILKGSAMESWTRKLAKADEDANFKLAKKVGNSKYEAYTFKFHGNYGFNASDWLADDSTNTGSYYAPVKKHRKGKTVTALRVGNGTDNSFSFYGYSSKKLAK